LFFAPSIRNAFDGKAYASIELRRIDKRDRAGGIR